MRGADWAGAGSARHKRIEERNHRWFAGYTPVHELYLALAREAGSRGAAVLHLGGGRDSMAVEQSLEGVAAHVVCLDPDLRAIRLNKCRLRVRGTGERLPFADARFDLILAEYVFEHLERPLEVLGECRRCLRPGGSMVFMCPNRCGYIYLISAAMPYWLHVWFRKSVMGVDEADTFPTYYRLNTVRRIRKTAGLAGLRLEMVRSYVGWPTYWEFSDLLHRIFVVAHRVLEILPPGVHLTLIGTLRREP